MYFTQHGILSVRFLRLKIFRVMCYTHWSKYVTLKMIDTKYFPMSHGCSTSCLSDHVFDWLVKVKRS